MHVKTFNDGWSFRAKASSFLEMFGQAQDWTPVQLPHDAMLTAGRDPAAGPMCGHFRGGVWEYRKEFFVPAEHAGKCVMLEFEGIYRSGTVYVNEAIAAQRPFGYSGFCVRIDELLRCGETNVVRVEATAQDDARWYSGAGIYRNVSLLIGEVVRIPPHGVRIATPDIDAQRALVEIATRIDSEAALPRTVTVDTEIRDAAGAVVARDSAPVTAWRERPQTLRQRIAVAHPALWSVDTPVLYTCVTLLRDGAAELDRVTTCFGIRRLQLDAGCGLRINGEPLKLRGACIHHDNGVLGAATFARAEERRVELLKAAGFNAIRSGHNPLSKAMLDACDRLGMLVLDEAFDIWTEPKANNDYAQSFLEWWERDIAAMVEKDFNHPSVILYSIGNEIPEANRLDGARRGRELADTVRRLDPTRFVTNAINAALSCKNELFAGLGGAMPTPPAGEGMGINTMMTMMQQLLPSLLQQESIGKATAEGFAALDVAGYNYMESRYIIDRELFPHRVIVGTETRPPQIADHWQLVRDNPNVIGDFTWTGWDYLGEAGLGRIEYDDGRGGAMGLLGNYPWLAACAGDLDITGFRRPVSYFREIVFGLRSAPYIAVRPPARHGVEPAYASVWALSDAVESWSWPGFDGKPVTVEVYADADEVELLINGAPVGRAPAAQYRALFETRYAAGEITAVAYRAGAEIGRTSLRSAGADMRLAARVDRPQIAADGADLAYVEIALTDAGGVVHHTRDRALTLTIEGPGVVQGFGSANPCTEETFAAMTHDTFGGRALAVVRATAAGTITLTVSADGCEPIRVVIEAR